MTDANNKYSHYVGCEGDCNADHFGYRHAESIHDIEAAKRAGLDVRDHDCDIVVNTDGHRIKYVGFNRALKFNQDGRLSRAQGQWYTVGGNDIKCFLIEEVLTKEDEAAALASIMEAMSRDV